MTKASRPPLANASSALAVAVVCLSLCFTGSSRAGLNQWTSQGPFGGAVASLAIDPTTPPPPFMRLPPRLEFSRAGTAVPIGEPLTRAWSSSMSAPWCWTLGTLPPSMWPLVVKYSKAGMAVPIGPPPVGASGKWMCESW